MFSLFFTTPAKQRLKHRRPSDTVPSRTEVILTWCLLAVWLVLMSFGVLMYVNPAWLQELSQPGRKVEAAEARRLGDDALRQGNYALAIGHFRNSLDILADQPGVWLSMAVAYRDAGDVTSGARILASMLQREGSPRLKAAIHYNLGELYEKQGKRDEALTCYEQASRYEVGDERTHRKLASLYAEAGQYEQARAACGRALEVLLDPGLEYAAMLRRGLDMYKDYPDHLPVIEAQLANGIGADELARYDLEIIRQVQQNSPEVAAVYSDLGLLCVLVDDVEGAIEYLQKVLQIQPDDLTTKNRLQQLQQRRQRRPSDRAEGG
jgi:tetratricopeptide (TPR) repeat protein